MLRLSEVAVLRGRPILQGIDLDVRPGERVALCGPSGAGKTTLLRVAAGEIEPSSGTVTRDGAPLREIDRRTLARRRAVLPQASRLGVPFQVDEVVRLGRLPHGSSARDAAIVRSCLHRAGVPELAGRSYETLSGGERQRVHLARVLAQLEGATSDPLLLLDEPTSALDIGHGARVLALASQLAQEGVAVVAARPIASS